ncbi:MAG: hypothetical protein ACOYN3_06035 [Acidimicrobiia bacterium]
MRRFTNGGTERPMFNRPGNGFGRPAMGAPRPMWNVKARPELAASMFCTPLSTPSFVWSHGGQQPEIGWATETSVPEIPALERI